MVAFFCSDREYEIRVVIVTASGESTVSPSKVIRMPTQQESWFAGPSFFSRFQNSTVFIGSACAFILLITSLVVVLFLTLWCRRRHQNLNRAHCPLPLTNTTSENAAQAHLRSRTLKRPRTVVGTKSSTYDSLQENMKSNTPRLIDSEFVAARPMVDPCMTNSFHAAETLPNTSIPPDTLNIPEVLQPRLTDCVWMDRVWDGEGSNEQSMNSIHVAPDLTRSLQLGKCRQSEFELFTQLHIPLTDGTYPTISCEPGFQTFTSRTFNL